MAIVLPSYRELADDVQSKHFTLLDHAPGLSDDVYREAMEIYHRFLALAPEVRKNFQMRFDPEHPETDSGLEPSKRGTVNKQGHPVLDDKWYFHYSVSTDERYGRFCDGVPEARALFDIARFIAVRNRELLRAFAKVIGKKHPEVEAAYHQAGVPQNGFLRFITYQAHGKDAVSATDHYDRDGYTLACAESEPGLYMGEGPGKPVTILPHQRNKTALFAGVLADELDGGALPKGWHGVKQMNDSVAGRADHRTSIVMFFCHRNSGMVSHAKTHPHLYGPDGRFLGQQAAAAI